MPHTRQVARRARGSPSCVVCAARLTYTVRVPHTQEEDRIILTELVSLKRKMGTREKSAVRPHPAHTCSCPAPARQ